MANEASLSILARLAPLAAYGPRLRIASGLILFAFAATHFINHALGLVSLELMQAGQDVRTLITRSPPGTAILVLAAVAHFVLGVSKFLGRHTWRIGVRDAVQLSFGLLIPAVLLRHVLGTRGAHELFGVEDSYSYAMWAMWPHEALNQAALMTLVWVHGSIGVHHWLIFRAWYRRWLWLWYTLALLIPVLGFAGFVAAGRTFSLEYEFDNPFSEAQYAQINAAFRTAQQGYLALLFMVVAVWVALLLVERYRRKITVTYANGPAVMVPIGSTLLEISRAHRIPHACVCGGRARCSTCRVRVIEGLEGQPAALDNEIKVLKRVGAPSNVRLACQLKPTADIRIATLLPAKVEALHGANPDKYLWGVEQVVTILFCDLRGFTRMSEGRLSYDVVFVLNQFLGRMGEAIEDTGGYVDKFMGDGIMAIFGMEQEVREGATRALAAARAMSGVLDSLNMTLREELPEGLGIGIGIHTGHAILGRIGSANNIEAANRITALGETVNIASRLEGTTKELGVQLVVSDATIAAAGVAVEGRLTARAIDIRGLSQPIAVFTAKKATELPA
jgi:adenylate cyclase